ncbi:hypothetical protein RJ639_003922 [Escallonia herrerae]|uniref:Uncharacterized protein n=1 Tax=Escallonia herrerae TaxID=1293975 RepID=A0AA88W2J6_9ASTE|nr:hypothetical protein RJ639_003922 [Escallonia herrerae]
MADGAIVHKDDQPNTKQQLPLFSLLKGSSALHRRSTSTYRRFSQTCYRRFSDMPNSRRYRFRRA